MCIRDSINNKVKRLALLSVLSDKAANGNMVVVDKFACDEYKTKTVVAMLNAVGAGKKNLLVNETVDAKFVKSAGNIEMCIRDSSLPVPARCAPSGQSRERMRWLLMCRKKH